MYEFLASLAVAVFSAVASAWIAVRLALKRFRAERWWDRRTDAYAAVIEALHNVKRDTERSLRESQGEAEIKDEDRRKQLQEKSRLSWDEIYKAVDTGSFLLCQEAREALDTMMEEVGKADEGVWRVDFNVYDALDTRLAAIDSCLRVFPSIARKDLGVP